MKKQLKDLVTLVGGYAFKSNLYKDSGIRVIRIANVQDGYISDEYPCFYPEEYRKEIGVAMLEENDLLMSLTGNVGRVAFLTNDMLPAGLNQRVECLRSNNVLLKRYLYFFFRSNRFIDEAIKNSSGIAQLNMSTKWLGEYEITLFNEDKTKHICDELESINNVINNKQNEIKLLDELIKSRFIEMFGNDDSRIEKLTDYVFFQEGPGVRTVDFRSEGTILLTGSNINNNEITFGHKADRFISNELANGKYSHFMCDKNDILVVASAIAPDKFDEKVVIVSENKKYCLNTGIIRFKPNLKYLTRGYFIEFLKSNYFKDQVAHNMKGIAQMHFGPSHLKTMTILVPNNLQKQIEFELFKEQIDKSKLIVQKQIDLLQELLDKKMNEYFG